MRGVIRSLHQTPKKCAEIGCAQRIGGGLRRKRCGTQCLLGAREHMDGRARHPKQCYSPEERRRTSGGCAARMMPALYTGPFLEQPDSCSAECASTGCKIDDPTRRLPAGTMAVMLHQENDKINQSINDGMISSYGGGVKMTNL